MAKKSASQKKQTKGSTTNHVILGLIFILASIVSFGGSLGAAGVGGLLLWRGSYLLLGAGALMIPVGLMTAGILVIIMLVLVTMMCYVGLMMVTM
jgi:hypothetical protein